jgi:hypothetical protein
MNTTTELFGYTIGSRVTYVNEVCCPVVVLNEELVVEDYTVLVSTDDGFCFRAKCYDLYTNPQSVKFLLSSFKPSATFL